LKYSPFKLHKYFISIYQSILSVPYYGQVEQNREFKSLKILLDNYDSDLILFAIPKYIAQFKEKSTIVGFSNLEFFVRKYKPYSNVVKFYKNIFELNTKKRQTVLDLLEEYEDYLEAIILSGDEIRRKKEIIEELDKIYVTEN